MFIYSCSLQSQYPFHNIHLTILVLVDFNWDILKYISPFSPFSPFFSPFCKSQFLFLQLFKKSETLLKTVKMEKMCSVKPEYLSKQFLWSIFSFCTRSKHQGTRKQGEKSQFKLAEIMLRPNIYPVIHQKCCKIQYWIFNDLRFHCQFLQDILFWCSS